MGRKLYSIKFCKYGEHNKMAKAKKPNGKENIISGVVQLKERDDISRKQIILNMKNLKLNVKFKNEAQERYWKSIENNEISLCSGPAGTGKSYLTIAKSIELLFDQNSKYDRIVVIKPVVEADEKLGALPGTMLEKLEPYTYSTKYLFEKILGQRRTEKLFEKEIIQIMALAYLRGVNIDNTILIFEEAQNSTPRQMKTLLTRIGENSKFIISGDHEQSDRYVDFTKTGLYIAINKLKDINEIGIHEFSAKDIVRNPIISKILEKFNEDLQNGN